MIDGEVRSGPIEDPDVVVETTPRGSTTCSSSAWTR